MLSFLTSLIRFRSKQLHVVHETGYDASAEDARRLCGDYAEFLKVHLSGFPGDPDPKWVKGGPGEVGAEVQYRYEYGGSVAQITDRVVKWEIDEKTGASTLGWQQVKAEPALPLRNYGCAWTTTPEPGSPDRCRVTWSRHFDEPAVLGLFSLGKVYIKRFQKSSLRPIAAMRPYLARTYPTGERRLPKKSDRVLVVGAGPSGLHMAHLLRRRLGIEDITIIEKSGRYGGKTVSVEDTTNENGIVHELGTCYLHPAYFSVRRLIEEIQELPEFDPTDGDNDDFGREVAPINYSVRTTGQANTDLLGWVTSNLRKQTKFSPWGMTRMLFPKANTAMELVAAKARFNRLHRKYIGAYNYSMPPQPTREAMKALDMSFGQFLETNGLSALLPILAYGQTCQGYGSIEETPAFWAMCWITPELLDGYFAVSPEYPKKSMLKRGWLSLWDTIVKVNGFGSRIHFETVVTKVERPADDDAQMTAWMSTIEGGDRQPDGTVVGGTTKEWKHDFDYLVIAAPGIDPIEPAKKGESFKHMTPEWSALVGDDAKEKITRGQFRTVLFKRKQPAPYTESHLTLAADRVLGPEVGKGDVFASRDSWLALHPEFCDLAARDADPLRDAPEREQMAYQYVENGRKLSEDELREKFHTWATGEMGSRDNYEVMQEESWTYFQRYDRDGLMEYLPWRLLAQQGKQRTLFVHASNFFESVLDIVNYNNMVVSGLGAELNVLGPLPDDPKPYHNESEHWKLLYGGPTRAALTVVSWALTTIWTVGYMLIRPLLAFTLVRIQRKKFQTAFHTKDPGPWWKFNMSHFLKVSPSVIAVLADEVDPVMELPGSKEEREAEYPDIPKTRWALALNYQDYRNTIRLWAKHVNPTYLMALREKQWWPLGSRGPSLGKLTRFFAANFPIAYNYLFSWIAALAFNPLTGYGYRREDDRGGGLFIPRCHMLRVARNEYGEEMGNRICTHVCKIFTEEYLTSLGMPVTLEPNSEKGSCWVRGGAESKPAFSDHTVAWWMTPPPDLAAKVQAERGGNPG